MGMPRSKEARLFYRCAIQRYDDAQVLRRAEHNAESVYLAGYGVECILKALILEGKPARTRRMALQGFRGGRAHDFEWLRAEYVTGGGAAFPPEVNRHFAFVNSWSTDLRYMPKTVPPDDADRFLKAANEIIAWASKRL
jgi:HEPN domain-containing protein